MNLSVVFWIWSCPRRSSSSDTFLSLDIAFSLSLASRRMLRIATRVSSAILWTCLASCLRRSSVGVGKVIRLTMPTPTEERRKQLAKQVHKIAEDTRVAIRNIRREANDKLKAMSKDKKVSEDEERRGHDQIQKTTDKFIAKVDDVLKKKEQEILSF